MKYVIYGDIHGCLEEWKELRKEIPKNSFEICLGDILDKGPYCVEALRYAQKNKIFSIMGNHEYKHLRKKLGKKVKLDENQQKIYSQLKKEDFDYISSMPFFLKLNHITLLHAGITNKINLNNPPLKIINLLMFIREIDENNNFLPLNHKNLNAKYWADVYDGHEGFIVYGHNPFSNPKINKYSIGIDTGCVYGNKLTAIIMEDTINIKYSIIQTNAKKQYHTPHISLK